MNEKHIVVCPHCHTANRIPVGKTEGKANCGKCKESLLDTKPINLDEKSFEMHVGTNEIPVVVDFWASWCGPCKMMGPVFEKVATKYSGRVRFSKIDTEAQQNVAARYNIRSIPTTIMFKNGKEVDRVSGALDENSLTQWIERNR